MLKFFILLLTISTLAEATTARFYVGGAFAPLIQEMANTNMPAKVGYHLHPMGFFNALNGNYLPLLLSRFSVKNYFYEADLNAWTDGTNPLQTNQPSIWGDVINQQVSGWTCGVFAPWAYSADIANVDSAIAKYKQVFAKTAQLGCEPWIFWAPASEPGYNATVMAKKSWALIAKAVGAKGIIIDHPANRTDCLDVTFAALKWAKANGLKTGWVFNGSGSAAQVQAMMQRIKDNLGGVDVYASDNFSNPNTGWAAASTELNTIINNAGGAVPTPTPVPTPVVNYLDSRVFAVNFYRNNYVDLKKFDDAFLKNHWQTYGMNECRQASPNFSASYYLAKYSDLKAAFGNNCKAGVKHFLEFGIREGRNGKPTTPPQPAACPTWAIRSSVAKETDDTIARQRAGKVDVGFIGDSITHLLAYYPNAMATFNNFLPGKTVGHFGVPGDTIETAMWRLCQAPPQANAFVITLGTNDLVIDTPQVMATRLAVMRDFLRSKNPTAKIVFQSLFNRAGFDVMPASTAIKSIAVGTNVSYVTYPLTETNSSDFPDGLHPNEVGWIKVINKLAPYLKSLTVKASVGCEKPSTLQSGGVEVAINGRSFF